MLTDVLCLYLYPFLPYISATSIRTSLSTSIFVSNCTSTSVSSSVSTHFFALIPLSLSLSHTHTTGTALIKQGDTNNKFYVLNEGNALIQVDGVSVGEQLAGTFSEVLTAVAAWDAHLSTYSSVLTAHTYISVFTFQYLQLSTYIIVRAAQYVQFGMCSMLHRLQYRTV